MKKIITLFSMEWNFKYLIKNCYSFQVSSTRKKLMDFDEIFIVSSQFFSLYIIRISLVIFCQFSIFFIPILEIVNLWLKLNKIIILIIGLDDLFHLISEFCFCSFISVIYTFSLQTDLHSNHSHVMMTSENLFFFLLLYFQS